MIEYDGEWNTHPPTGGPKAAFAGGSQVVCVNDNMGNIGSALTKGKTYRIHACIALEEIRYLHEYRYWEKAGYKDLVILEDGTEWSSHRFRPA